MSKDSKCRFHISEIDNSTIEKWELSDRVEQSRKGAAIVLHGLLINSVKMKRHAILDTHSMTL